MKPPSALPPALLRACARRKVRPTRYVLVVDISRQTAALYEPLPGRRTDGPRHFLAKSFPCSTSKFGVGETAGSNKTPRGLHRIAEKIGSGLPVGTVFRGRKPVGYMEPGESAAAITSRILWLEGLEPGLNRGGDVDSHARYIYIHGTGNEADLGTPDSHGCVHLAAEVLIPLYDKVPSGTLVWMTP